jgi:DNA-binding NarL/FixJ family response regulator/tetratricopeptide (TPR) repeat protein
VAALERGELNALMVVGEPGIGKTRLLAELAARGDANGCVVLSGTASELELDLPFWVFVDALDDYAAGQDPRRLASLEDDIRAELARVFPSFSEFAARGQPALQDERYRAHRAVRELLERMAATRPLVLVLDDVHWADAASIELLGALLRRPPAAKVLLAIGARPRQLPERLASALERANRAESLVRLELRGLQRDEAAELLGEGFEGEVADRLYEESGGNPFYLEQLARSTRLAADTRRGDRDPALVGVEVPAAVAAALTGELGLLSAPTRTLLEGAAVAGDPFEPELAAAAAAMGEESAVVAIDDLLALELVRTTDVPRRFRFRHPLVRRAVYETAPSGWLLGAHERCAAALAERGASAPARAHHVERAARQGDAAALGVLREAGQASALRAPASAARWFGAALRLMPESAPPEQRVELLLARAEALGATGRLEESRTDLIESITLVPEGLLAMRTKLTVVCAGVEHMLGRHKESRARITAALDTLRDRAAPEAVELLIVLAFDGLFRADFAAMREAAERALAAARPLGDRPLTATAASVLALACAWGGMTSDAEDARQEAVALVEAMSDDELASRIDAPAYLAAAELYLDRYEETIAHAERALTVGRATGQQFPTLVPILAIAYLMRGRLAEAIEVIEGGVESARLANNIQDLAWRLHVRSSTALAAGDLDTALTSAEEAMDLARELEEHNFLSAYPGLGLAAALLQSGDPAGAVEVLIGSAGGPELPLIPGGWRAMAHELITHCYLELGRRDEAARAAGVADATAGAIGLPMATAWAERAAAAVAFDAGEPAAAAKRALASAAAAERAGGVVEAALSRTLAGRALAQAGKAAEAATALTGAAAALDACGAPRYRDAAERELRRQGHHIHRRTRPGIADGHGLETLTERELEVARLVVDRKTNAEIATALFLSVKTIETHVRNLFRKLDVSSRVEIARTVERADRSEQAP